MAIDSNTDIWQRYKRHRHFVTLTSVSTHDRDVDVMEISGSFAPTSPHGRGIDVMAKLVSLAPTSIHAKDIDAEIPH